MPYIPCKVCDTPRYVKPSHIRVGWGKFCSKTCQYTAQRTGTVFICTTCGKDVYRNKSDQHRSNSETYFCSKSCQTTWRNKRFVREKHKNWVNGESSYRDALKRASKKMWCEKCSILDTRVLAVHHKDKNRKNNDLQNLIWLCHNCHFLVHHYPAESHGFLTYNSVSFEESSV